MHSQRNHSIEWDLMTFRDPKRQEAAAIRSDDDALTNV
jgi:hypothetical protein